MNSEYELAPIVLFVYNRPEHTFQTVEALKRNKLANQSELIIFCDAAKNKEVENSVKKVREYVKTISGFKSIKIIEREVNFGLAKSIINGVTDIVNIYGLVIIGLSLILGAYVKLVSVGGIALLSMYYLSHPPLIDANYILRTEGSALWVDKNLIMLCAFLVIIYFPTSKLIGLDRYLLKK